MNILAFDTSLGACSAAVAQGDGDEQRIHGCFELRERQHAETLIPMIETSLSDASLDWKDIAAIAVTRGPGSFTGVRVGVAAARGFALALGVPLIAANSLDVIAKQASLTADLPPGGFAVAVDARRGEVYLAIYDTSGVALTLPEAVSPGIAAAKMRDAALGAVVGSGGPLVSASGDAIEAFQPDIQPDARVLASMAGALAPLKEPLRPLYLRPPDAKPQAGKSVARQQD